MRFEVVAPDLLIAMVAVHIFTRTLDLSDALCLLHPGFRALRRWRLGLVHLDDA